jgi:hypothetical protein
MFDQVLLENMNQDTYKTTQKKCDRKGLISCSYAFIMAIYIVFMMVLYSVELNTMIIIDYCVVFTSCMISVVAMLVNYKKYMDYISLILYPAPFGFFVYSIFFFSSGDHENTTVKNLFIILEIITVLSGICSSYAIFHLN